jgi:molecular chaperone GrpE
MQNDANTTSSEPSGTTGQPTDTEAQAGAAGAGQATSPADAAEVAALKAEVEKLNGQISELTDRLLRAHAEMDNVRKRAEREKSDTAKYAITKFANDVANVADNFDRAIQSVPATAAAEMPALKSLLDGVTMTEREFLNVLERHGVRRIDPKGEPFNPHLHQAVMEMQNADVAAGTVLQVYQCGYMIEDRVLRPAMVVVAKGGFKPVKPAEPAPDGPAPAMPANENGGADGQQHGHSAGGPAGT